MRRRHFLASGAAVLLPVLAGCAHPPVVLDMDEATDDDVADEVSQSVDPDDEEYDIVQSALENGSATQRARREAFDRTDTVRFEGAFYDVSRTRLDSEDVTVYDVVLHANPDDETPEVGEIAYADLPETDQQRLEPLVTDELPSTDAEQIGVSYGSAEEVGDDSVFVPERQYDVLVHEGDAYRVTLERHTATETEYRYEFEEVAPDVETFAEQVRDEYEFELSGLSSDEREVVEAAIDGGYFEETDAFQSVVDRIRDHDAIEAHDFYGTWLVEYENTTYVTYVEW